jgi:predicted LPLAT superfamily acyltransferase
MSQEWARLPERGNLLALRLICWIARHIGRSAGRALLYPITLYFLIAATDARRGSGLYLRRVLGRKPSGRDLFRHIHCFAATILDRVYFLTGRLRYFKFAIVGGSWIQQQVASGQGCILLGSHLGSFEALRALGTTLPRLPLKILMKVEHNQTITQLLNTLNPALAQMIIPIGRPETLLEVQDNVAQGFLIGALGDRVAQGEKTVRCQFLGQETAFPIGPMLLAALMDCPVILFFGLYRGGNRYDIHFELFAERIVLEPRRRQQQLTVWIQRYAERLEYYARLAPYNWFNFYNYWDENVH